MKNKIVLSLAAILTVSSLNASELLKDIKVDISDTVRYSAEDDSNKHLNATTNKLNINLSGDIKVIPQTSFELGLTDIRNIDDQSDTREYNGQKQTKLNRANLTTNIHQIDTVVKAGRQAVTMDKGSLISNDPWALMERTVDRVTVVNNSIKDLTLTTAYGWQVNPSDTKNNLKTDFLLLNAKYNILDGVTISVYDYLIEDHSDTYGSLFDMRITEKGLSYLTTVEYNQQKDANIGNATNVDGKFYNVNIGLGALGTDFRVGHLVSKDRFDAPLGDNHNFLGTSDMIGHGDVKSTYVTLDSQLTNSLTANVSYHYLKKESDSKKLGNEVDLGLTYKFNDNLSFLAKTALFNSNSEGGLQDDKRTWVEAKITF